MLKWVFERCAGTARASRRRSGSCRRPVSSTSPAWTSPTRTSPRSSTVDPEAFKAQLPQVREFLAKFGDDLPAEISSQLEAFEERLDAA